MIKKMVRPALLLLPGLVIYAIFRKPLSIFKNIFPNWKKPLIDISGLPDVLAQFLKYHLPDMLWAASLYMLLRIFCEKKLITFGIVALSVGAFELSQLLGFIKGTGDVLDVLFSLVPLFTYIIIFERKSKNEQDVQSVGNGDGDSDVRSTGNRKRKR